MAAAVPCAALVDIPFTREALPVRCLPGNCYYVDGINGSDANDGTTLQRAWQTLRHAHDAIPGGATVLVADGVYTTDASVNPVVLRITKSGSAASWTTFAALTGHRPVIQVPKGAYMGIHVPSTHHVLIDGFEFVGRAQSMTLADTLQDSTPSERCLGIGGGDLPQSRDVIIRNSVFHDCPGGGILYFAADSAFILYNHVYNNGWYTVEGNAGINIIRQADSAGSVDIAGYRSYVVGNLLERNWNYLPWSGLPPPLAGKICDGDGIIVDDNKHTQPGHGLPGDVTGVPYNGRTYIANNIVRDSGAQGINAFKSSHVDIVNNTTYNSLLTETCNIHGEITVTDSSDVNVINNVAVNLNGKGAVSANGGFLDYNVWSGGQTNQSLLGAHDIQDDSVLIAPADGDFAPSKTSPAIGNGSEALAPAVDFFGNPRPASRIDRGAIQMSSPSVVEYFHAAFNHYFVTALPVEISKLNAGLISGWQRTGQIFNANLTGASGTANVCRFFSTSFDPKSSHFYTPYAAECAEVKQNRDWQFEGEVFAVVLPDSNGSCAVGTIPLYRLCYMGRGERRIIATQRA